MIPAYSPQARGRSERNFGTWQGRLLQELRLQGIRTVEAANAFLRAHYIAEFNRRFQVRAAQAGNAFVPRRSRDLDLIFALQFERTVNRDNTISFQHLSLQIEAVRWRGSLAGCTVTVHQHLDGWIDQPDPRTASIGSIQLPRCDLGRRQNAARTGGGKDARWKSPKTDFPTSLGNPAKTAGFPLSHSPDCCWLIMKPDISRATKSGPFNLLPTPGLLARNRVHVFLTLRGLASIQAGLSVGESSPVISRKRTPVPGLMHLRKCSCRFSSGCARASESFRRINGISKQCRSLEFGKSCSLLPK